MDLIQYSPSKEMEISAGKVNAVLQESMGLSQFRSPPPTFFPRARIPSKLLRWQNTRAIVRALWSQSIQGRHTFTTLSLTSSALLGINNQGKEISPCATTPSSCQEQCNTQIPSYNNCIATRKKKSALSYTNGSQTLYLRVHIKFYFQFPTFLQLTLHQRETWCFKMPLQSYSSQGITKFMSSTSRSLYSKSKVWEGRENCQSFNKKESQHSASLTVLQAHSHPENFSAVKVSLIYSLFLNSVLTACEARAKW